MHYHTNSLIIFLITVASISISILSCRPKEKLNKKEKVARVYLRHREDFYCISVKENGEAHIEAGRSSFYTEPFVKRSSCSSHNYFIDSAAKFWSVIRILSANEDVGDPPQTAPRIEVYYDTVKICNSYIWRSLEWDLIRSVTENPPK